MRDQGPGYVKSQAAVVLGKEAEALLTEATRASSPSPPVLRTIAWPPRVGEIVFVGGPEFIYETVVDMTDVGRMWLE